MTFLESLPQRFGQRVRKYGVPGASLAILRGSRVIATAASGVTSLDHGVPVSDDTLFQIGSITKPFTTTLAMQLVDEGLLDLDRPVRHYLPDFRVADETVARSVTCRHLLSHQSGIDGDFFVESGRDDDAGERLIRMASMMPNLFPVGEQLSYCNLGFVIVGQITQKLRDKPWHDVLREHLFNPLEMSRAFSRPEDAIRFSCAIGHVPSRRRKGEYNASTVPYLSQGQAAAGATPTMTATDLLKFARLHLDGGKNRDGQKVLTARSVKAMQRLQMRVPKHFPRGLKGWGLGWMLMNLDGHAAYGHDGGTIGQASFLRIIPDKNLAIALLTNGGDAAGLYTDVFRDALKSLARIDLPEPPAPDPSFEPSDLSPYEGSYRNLNATLHFYAHQGRLMMRHEANGGESEGPYRYAFFGKDAALPDTDDPIQNRNPVLFLGKADGKMRYISAGSRVMRRL